MRLVAPVVLLLCLACGGLVPAPGPSGDAPDEPLRLGKTEQRQGARYLPPVLGGSSAPPVAAALDADQCADLSDGGSTIDGCITAEITCGETLIGHTRGGARRFDTRFYQSKFCTPGTTDHDGGDERIYRLVVPDGDRRAIVTLDTPCADLDVAAMLWDGEDCPTAGHSIPRCEMQPEDGTRREQLELVSQHGATWLVVVEGKGSDEGAFGLSVQCLEGLH